MDHMVYVTPPVSSPGPRFDVTCHRVGTDQERRVSIRALVAILLAQPQSPVDAPSALATLRDLGIDRMPGDESRPEPLPYQRLSELYSSLKNGNGSRHGARAPQSRASQPRTARVTKRRKPSIPPGAQAPSPSMARRARPKEGRRRPGKGGRQPRVASATATLATGQLEAALGEPDHEVTGARSSRCEIWERPDLSNLVTSLSERDPWFTSGSSNSGNTGGQRQRVALINRLSSHEIQGGETIGGQMLETMRTAIGNDCEIVAVLACTNYYSELGLEERTDFNWIFEQVELGLLDGIVFREPDRVARRLAVVHPFYDRCEKLGIDLYLASLGRAVDWTSEGDRLQISMQNTFAEAEARRFAAKAMEAKKRRWAGEGRGWPGSKRFGFRRDADKFLEVDPEQWPLVEYIHEQYGELDIGGKSGCRTLSVELAKRGCDLSPERIRTILLDSIYVDGNWTIKVDGELIACRPVELERPISRSTFQRNAEMLGAQKGKFVTTPPGTNLLNGIPVEHAPCCKTLDPRTGYPPWLKVNNSRAGSPSYTHRGKAPRECHRYRIPQRDLEGAVVRELLALADDEDLQKAWAAAALVRPGADRSEGEELQMSFEVQRAELRQEVSSLEAAHDREIGRLVELDRKGQEPSRTDRAIAERIEQDLDERRRRLEVVDASLERHEKEAEQASSRTKEELLGALRSILTEDIPEDLRHRVRRLAVVECCLSKVVVHDIPGSGEDIDEQPGYTVQLFGPLVPERAIPTGAALPISPLSAARHVLEAELRDQEAAAGAKDPAGGDEPDDDAGDNGDDAGPKQNSSTQVPTYKELFRIEHQKKTPEGRRSTRDARLLENRWLERLDGLGDWDTPVWVSPRRPGGKRLPRYFDRPSRSDTQEALLEIAAALAPGEGFTFGACERWYKEDRKNRISPYTLIRTAKAHRMGLRELQKITVPGAQLRTCGPRRMPPPPPTPWTYERCEEVLRLVVAAHHEATDSLLTLERFKSLTAGDPDLPPINRLHAAAHTRGLTPGKMINRVLIAQGLKATRRESEKAEIARCRRAILDAASTLPVGKPLSIDAYLAWYRSDRDRRPSYQDLWRAAELIGMTFISFRDDTLPAHATYKSGRNKRRWTDERIVEAVDLAIHEFADRGERPSWRGYQALREDGFDLPFQSTVMRCIHAQNSTYRELFGIPVKKKPTPPESEPEPTPDPEPPIPGPNFSKKALVSRRRRRPGREAAIKRCRWAMLAAAASLPAGQKLTWNAYGRWHEESPLSRPKPAAVRRAATYQGYTFSSWRNKLVPDDQAAKERLPDGYWTLRRCRKALLRAALQYEARHDKSMSAKAYLELCRGRLDLPSEKRLRASARRNGTSIGDLVREAVTGAEKKRQAGDPK
jgi:DNA invertase Pin-like site-specific DNA recombinase